MNASKQKLESSAFERIDYLRSAATTLVESAAKSTWSFSRVYAGVLILSVRLRNLNLFEFNCIPSLYEGIKQLISNLYY